MKGLARLSIAIAWLLALVAACALPTDDSPQELGGPEIENAMNPTTTSSTAPAGSTQQRELFYFDREDLLAAELRPVPLGSKPADILNLLGQTPTTKDWRTSVPETFLVSTTDLAADGTLTVVLADDTLFALGGEELPRAVAQIVVTARRIQDVPVTGVRFQLDGQERQVPAGPNLTNTSDPVDECDYRQFLPGEQCAALSQETTTSVAEAQEPGGPE